MMRVIFMHGEKGGVGKSTMALPVLETAIELGLSPFLVEGDTGIPDVAARYRGVVEGFQVPLARQDLAEEALGELVEQLEQKAGVLNGRPVVINLPAGAGATVDSKAALIRDVCDATGWELVVLYAMGPGLESPLAASKSLGTGLAGLADTRIAVPNLHLGEPTRWDWQKSPARQAWLESGGLEIQLPAMTPRGMEKLRGAGPLGPLVRGEKEGLFIIDRSIVYRWLAAARPLAHAALGLLPDEGGGNG